MRAGSWITKYLHVAEIMGRYHLATGKTWTDEDLVEPYNFGKNIKFKLGHEPMGKATLYRLEAADSQIDLLDRRHEHQIKMELPVKKVL